MMELRHLRYFVTVAEERNISRAALVLRVAQPALSRQLSDLENDLGVRLMERGRHGVSLTAAGREFHRRAKSLLADARRAADAARAAGGAISGRLSLGFTSALQLDHLLPVIQAFRDAHPGVDLDFLHLSHPGQLAALRDGTLDLAFLDLSAPPRGHSHLVVWQVPFSVVLPDHHPLARRESLTLRDLQGEDFIFCTRESRPAFHDAYFKLCANAGFRPHVVREIGGYPSNMLALVAMGLGISVLPRFDRAENLRGITWRPLTPPILRLDFSLVWRSAATSPAASAFTALAAALLPAPRVSRPDPAPGAGPELPPFF